MVDLTADKRRAMPPSQFAMPGKRFPISDPTHARLAIGGATRSEHTGNISPAMADKIKAAARAKLHATRHKNLTKASAKHLHNAGHIGQAQHDEIVQSAGQPFGSLAPQTEGS